MVLLYPSMPAAQTPAPDRRTEIARTIERRIEARQPFDLSADTITIEGDVVRLKGHVRIVLGPDMFVRTDEATFDRAARRVQLIGNVWVSRGASPGAALPRPAPGPEYR